jgi:hypothetical protein
MKKLIFFFLSISLIASCNETEELALNMNEVKRLSFASHEDFKAITEDISKMNDQELDQWEKNQDFVSFRTVLNTAYKESETIQTEKDLSQFLDKYNDILTLEDSILTPSIKSIRIKLLQIEMESIRQVNI